MTDTTVLIVGADSQLGRQLVEAHPLQHVVATSHRPGKWPHVDLNNPHASERVVAELISKQRLAAVFLTAAATHVDWCESHELEAFRMNAETPGALAALTRRHGIPFVYYSTDYVFDGASGPYCESDVPRPLSAYGRSKRAGEEWVLDEHPDALVIRTTNVYGFDANRRNFLYGIADRARGQAPFRLPVDQTATPTWNRDLAQVSKWLVEKRQRGVFHVASDELISRFDFGRIILRELGLDPNLAQPTESALLGQAAPRPLRGGLRSERTLPDANGLRCARLAETAPNWRSWTASQSGNSGETSGSQPRTSASATRAPVERSTTTIFPPS